jgi:hypothetical protein
VNAIHLPITIRIEFGLNPEFLSDPRVFIREGLYDLRLTVFENRLRLLLRSGIRERKKDEETERGERRVA